MGRGCDLGDPDGRVRRTYLSRRAYEGGNGVVVHARRSATGLAAATDCVRVR